jgi:hypothetical protein
MLSTTRPLSHLEGKNRVKICVILLKVTDDSPSLLTYDYTSCKPILSQPLAAMQKNIPRRVLHISIVLLVFSSLKYSFFFQKHDKTLYNGHSNNWAADYTKMMLLKVSY